MADDSNSSGIFWFLAGLGIGAAVGILYAPKSGRETRETIFNYAEEGRNAVSERAKQYRDQAQQWYEKGKDVMNQQRDQVRSAFEAGRQAYREVTQEPAPEGPKS